METRELSGNPVASSDLRAGNAVGAGFWIWRRPFIFRDLLGSKRQIGRLRSGFCYGTGMDFVSRSQYRPSVESGVPKFLVSDLEVNSYVGVTANNVCRGRNADKTIGIGGSNGSIDWLLTPHAGSFA